MKVINSKPNQRILLNGYKKFKFNWYRVILFVLLFPVIYFLSKKYVRKFFSMNQEFQKDGKLKSDEKIRFNSFETYYEDSKVKGLHLNDFIFDKKIVKRIQGVNIKNKDGLNISSLILQNNNSNKWVIGFHGWTENKYLALRQVLYFYRKGYNVLTFDAIGHGLTYGKYTGIGFHNSKNITIITNWIKNKHKASEIGLIGNSMGASCILKYLIDNKTEDKSVNWAIFDCGFSNLLTQFRYVMTYRYKMPWWLISFGLVHKCKKELDFNLRKYNLLKNLENIKNFPLLMFHGLDDDFVPYFMSKKIYDARLKIDSKENMIKLCGLNNTNHVQAICKDNNLYQQKIKEFLEEIKEK